ncbi:set1/Ash2 histone methyltransferase complex subunit ASH2 isoform X1 [Trichogramma pretiosum]|uniref:set1/Ash2 histone methyltransferase complex subunit ASH2 isoform X1 n=1 Tax=Trichogramma pretiosum TaxID=7493 RepID=UPI0006C9DD65|nr:set1/Ash2 histone methyltransferase complex subunit ASH2 isoform X1 [Trichogramma pretiosum]
MSEDKTTVAKDLKDEENAPLNGISKEEKPLSETASETNKETIDQEKQEKPNGRANIGEKGSCYCGKERNLNIIELLCSNCRKWFHESCISYQLGKLVPFMTNYVFTCKNCSQTGLESFKKNQAQFPQMCVTAIANLMQTSIKENTNKTKFNKEADIIPFIEMYWESLTTKSRRVTQSWHSSIQKALSGNLEMLFTIDDNGPEPLYGLKNSDLVKIKPNYEAMMKGGMLKMTEIGVQQVGILSNNRGRNAKRKFPNEGVGGPGGKKGRGSDTVAPKLPAHGYPLEHPWNKDGYRYILAEPDPHAPFRQEFDESSDLAGKPIPGWLYRPLSPSVVLLALHDRASQLKVSEDRLSVTGDKGYCLIRATHYVTRGTWYWEATIKDMPDNSATRIGWGQEYSNLQAPLGYDQFGYSWRSRKGTRFHESRGKHYGEGYGENDVLGFLITLPDKYQPKHLPKAYKDRPLVKFKSHLYYEDKDNLPEAVSKLKPLPGSKIIFYKNGVSQGEAFVDINIGSYYPSISVYKSATVSVNFGPNFKFPPKDIPFKGVHEKAVENIAEQTISDLLFLTENEGKLRLDAFAS